MRLKTRIARLEELIPPPVLGCDACRGRLVLGLGEFEVIERGRRTVCVCAACGREPDGGTNFVGVSIEEVL